MLSFKQFVREMNDNPDPKAVADQGRKAMKAANKPKASEGEKEFYSKKAKAMADLNKSREK